MSTTGEATSGVRLVAVDMDGTFLDSTGNYDRPRFAAIHRELQRKGIRFVVASGNQYWALRTFFPDHPDVLYIAENGAVIATADHTFLRTVEFAPSDAAQAIALVDELPARTIVCGARAAYALPDISERRLASLRRYYERIEIVDDWSRVPEPVLKLALVCRADTTSALFDHLAADLPPGCVPTSSGHGSIDIISRGTHKGAALTWLGDELGIRAHEMVAFGDGGNDLEMLATAGIGVAMANAPAEVHAVADEVTGSNDQSGVLTWLERLVGEGTPASR